MSVESPTDSNPTKQITASCPSGKKVLGGDMQISGDGKQYVADNGSHPITDAAFRGEAQHASDLEADDLRDLRRGLLARVEAVAFGAAWGGAKSCDPLRSAYRGAAGITGDSRPRPYGRGTVCLAWRSSE